MKRMVFHNPEHQAQWDAENFLVVPFLKADEVLQLIDFWYAAKEEPGPEFFLSLWTKNLKKRQEVDAFLASVFDEKISRYVNAYKPLIHSYAIKHSGDSSSWHVHQDDTFTDESRFESLSFWVPLVDVDANNGAMQIMKGSHRLYTEPRCPTVPKPFRNQHELIKEKYLTTIPMKAGEALIFGHRLVHASGNNTSGKDRPAAVGVYLPKEAPVWFYYREQGDPPEKTQLLQLPDDYYLRFPLGEKPVGEGVTFLKWEKVSEEELGIRN